MIEEKYQELLKIESDVNLHFPLIRRSVEKGDRVVELGVRECVSTWALLASRPASLTSIDVISPPETTLKIVKDAAKKEGIQFDFVECDSTMAILPPFDVLFIDTLHLYSHIIKELWRHSEKTRKRIVFHDSNIPEVRACIQDFLYNTNWRFEEESPERTGLMVVKRVA